MKDIIRMIPYFLVAMLFVVIFTAILSQVLPTAKELVPAAELILKGMQ